MKILSISLLAVLALSGLPASGQETLKERAEDILHETKQTVKRAASDIANSSREAWKDSKGYVSDDPETYRLAVQQRLGEINADISALQQSPAGVNGRTYFATYLTAIRQQSDFAKAELATLTPDDIRRGRDGQRQRVDLTIQRLDEHLDLAEREAKDFLARP